MTHVLTPLEAPFSQEVGDVLKGYPQQDGYILALFRTFANSLRFLKKGVPNLLDKGSPLSLRVREIVILATTAHTNCEYEWGVHVAIFANAAKLTPEQVAATRSADIDRQLWSPQEANLLVALRQLCTGGRMDDTILAEFQGNWTQEQQLEIFALCGTYHTISFVANNARLPNEPFGARFPQ
jgi:Carboxymuconolactone decarboxylase family